MDRKVEDKIVRQIEKNLSNNINENLFLTGRIFEKDTKTTPNTALDNTESMVVPNDTSTELSVDSYQYNNPSSPILSRAEYIRQARESCLRQLSAMQSGSGTYNTIYPDADPISTELLGHKKAKAMKLFRENSMTEVEKEENTPQEIAAFRFLIIRMVCAIMIFLSIFIFDKFSFKIGTFTPEVVREYVTGNDTLRELENILVTWLE